MTLPAFNQVRMGQRKPEYLVWTALCLTLDIESYVELGSGSAAYTREAGVPRVIAVDIMNPGERHVPYESESVRYIRGDSHDPKTRDDVLYILGGSPECVFIDAGHAYDEVRADYELWSPVATRLVGFHDIHIPDVRRFWEEICVTWPGGSVEITGRDIASARAWQGPGTSPDGRISGGGIGVLFKE